MNEMVRVVAVLIVSLVLGVTTALLVINNPPARAGVRNGSWVTNLEIGSAEAGIYVRAVVARMGLFALNKTETIYYAAVADDTGKPLRSGCDYRIEGKPLPTRWWSITLYGEDHFLIPNERGVYAYNMKNLERDDDEGFTIHLSGSKKAGNWLPAGDREQKLSLSLRCYNPEPSMYQKPEKIALPRITREGCR